jgi:hypothetical protein
MEAGDPNQTSEKVTFTGGLSARKLRKVNDFIAANYDHEIKLA